MFALIFAQFWRKSAEGFAIHEIRVESESAIPHLNIEVTSRFCTFAHFWAIGDRLNRLGTIENVGNVFLV